EVPGVARAGLRNVEAGPIVPYAHAQPPSRPAHPNLDALRAAMPCRVVERLLRDPVARVLRPGRGALALAVRADAIDARPRRGRLPLGEPRKRLHEAQLVELRRAQLPRDDAQALDDLVESREALL